MRCGVREESGGPLVSDRSGSIRFAGAGRLFLCPLSNIRRVDSCARTRARGHNLAPVSTPIGFVAHGFAGILYLLPSLTGTPVVGRDSNRLPPNVEGESYKTQYPCSTMVVAVHAARTEGSTRGADGI